MYLALGFQFCVAEHRESIFLYSKYTYVLKPQPRHVSAAYTFCVARNRFIYTKDSLNATHSRVRGVSR